MKKILVGLMMVAMGLLIMTTVASAYSVSAGDYVTINLGVRDGSNNGGAFNISKGTGSTLFDTFCLEYNEYFNPGQSYYIGSITAGAINGGIGGQTSNNYDPISSNTAYLFSQWANGSIARSPTNASALQMAIWKYEDELPTTSLSGLAQTYYNQAAGATGLASDYGVAVMNIYNSFSNGVYTGNAQDMLVYSAVPEPATMLLLGLGLVGLAGARRKFEK